MYKIAKFQEYCLNDFLSENDFFREMAALTQLSDERSSTCMCLNVNAINIAQNNERFRKILQGSTLLRPDGVGVCLASNILYGVRLTRLIDADFFPRLLEYLSKKNLSVYLLGSKDGVAEKAIKKIEKMGFRHSVVGFHHGYILHDKALGMGVIEDINRKRPDIVVVGMGMPLQEYWIEENREKLDVKVLYAVGGLLDYFGGEQLRVGLAGKIGMEWLFRLVTQPRRLARRYLWGNSVFIFRMLTGGIKNRNNIVE